jgi:hypothetical protein
MVRNTNNMNGFMGGNKKTGKNKNSSPVRNNRKTDESKLKK